MDLRLLFVTGFAFLAGSAASAQIAPPTTQQLQQQHNQTIQTETNAAHSNLTQLQIQQQQTSPRRRPSRAPGAWSRIRQDISQRRARPVVRKIRQENQTSRLFCTAAAMKLVKSGCGSKGRDFNSGWN